jgi:hypothetical protein
MPNSSTNYLRKREIEMKILVMGTGGVVVISADDWLVRAMMSRSSHAARTAMQ